VPARQTDALYVFLHVHKAAGNTFLANMLPNFERAATLPVYARPVGLVIDSGSPHGWDRAVVDRYVREHDRPGMRLVYGHMAYWGIHETLGSARDPFYLTFLRDPVERVISLYQYHRRFGGNWHQEIARNGWSIEEWLEGSEMLWRSNGQIRQLLWHACPEVLRHETVTEDHLEQAKAILRRFGFVGTTEAFDRDAPYLYGLLGARRFHEQEVVNASPDKVDAGTAARARIAELNRLDLELYAFAEQRRAELLAERGRGSALYLSSRARVARWAGRRAVAVQSARMQVSSLVTRRPYGLPDDLDDAIAHVRSGRAGSHTLTRMALPSPAGDAAYSRRVRRAVADAVDVSPESIGVSMRRSGREVRVVVWRKQPKHDRRSAAPPPASLSAAGGGRDERRPTSA
jgi:hypothetical protein